MSAPRPIKIAIAALGGQGGGVLADWIVRLGEATSHIAQSTSVPGVAQRTGATIYYIELFPEHAARDKGAAPVLALSPSPGDVDIVLAAELMEAGRAILRGFVTENTILIASSHRDYAIAEKIALGDGRQGPERIVDAARQTAKRAIIADMAEAAASAGAVISASIFGALAGSGALGLPREAFEDTIRRSGKAVESNLAAFDNGFHLAGSTSAPPTAEPESAAKGAEPSAATRSLVERLNAEFPQSIRDILRIGLERVADFQDARYGALYLDRLQDMLAFDKASGGEDKDWRVTRATGKHLALWMTYEDAIRVADLKTRASRFARFRDDVRAAEGQIVHVSEYLHPRVEEICDLLPTGIASAILKGPRLRKALSFLLGGGKRIPTTKLRGFLMLYLLASLRFLRRGSYRFKLEQARIADWLTAIEKHADENYDLACEIAALQRLNKGYGETHERGRANYMRIMAAMESVEAQADPVAAMARLGAAALADEDGIALAATLRRLAPASAAA